MLREPRRRSPESSRRRRAERRTSREQLAAAAAMPSQTSLRSRADSTASGSSSTSSSLLNISRKSRRFGLRSFFTARSSKRSSRRSSKHRFRTKNGSSSSIDSDLAYGKGYISNDSVEGQRRARDEMEHRRRERPEEPLFGPDGRPMLHRAQTDEEILEIGRKLSAYARAENRRDLERAGKPRPSQFAAAAAASAAALGKLSRHNTLESQRGIGSSKPHDDHSDDGDWESASDDDSVSDEGLTYGAANFSNQHLPRIQAPAPTVLSQRPPETIRPPNRKSSAVDPAMFGPVNSLRGLINTPCGFKPGEPRPGEYNRQEPPLQRLDDPIPQSGSASIEARPMRTVYAAPTSDPTRFDAISGSVVSSKHDVSNHSRPGPIPIQQSLPIQAPKPRVPVSTRVLEERRMEEEARDLRNSRRKPEGKGFADAAVAGVAAAALGAAGAVLWSDRKEEEKEKRDRDDRRERSGRRERDERYAEEDRERSLRDLEKKELERNRASGEKRDPDRKDADHRDRRSSKRDSVKIVDERDAKKNEQRGEKKKEETRTELHPGDRKPTREERRAARAETQRMLREIQAEIAREREKASQKEQGQPPTENRRDSGKSSQPVDNVVGQRHFDEAVASSSSKEAPIDPFQFQVPDDAFQTPVYATPRRPLTPNITTIEREPEFSHLESDSHRTERLSRRDSYEHELQQARVLADAAHHSTIPAHPENIAAAISAIHQQERGRSRDRSRVRGKEPVRDAVQEAADAAYRESRLAQRLEEEQIRSRSASPDSSVVEKWTEHEEEPVVRIITPPEMDRHPAKSPYDGPNADVRIDNVIVPRDLSKFKTPSTLGDRVIPIFKSRDPSCERERPLLNLVLPTPLATPSPERQRTKEKNAEVKDDTKSGEVKKEVIINPRGEVAKAPPIETAPSKPTSEEPGKFVHDDGSPEETGGVQSEPPKKKKKGKKSSSGWGVIAAAVAGSAAGAAVASNKDDDFKALEGERDMIGPDDHKSPGEAGRDVPQSPTAVVHDLDDVPPKIGPKPSSPRSAQMPGAFADDLDFTATVAAGLQGSGFDPNIVIDDPTFRRRDSPPGSDTNFYKQPTAETATELGVYGNEQTQKGEGEPPLDDFGISSKLSKKERRKQEKVSKLQGDGTDSVEGTLEHTENTNGDDFGLPRPSKKEQRKREKAAKSLSEEEVTKSFAVEESQPPEPVDAGEDEWASPKLSKKDKKKRDKGRNRGLEEELDISSNPVTIGEPQPPELVGAGEDEWASPKLSKKEQKKRGEAPGRPPEQEHDISHSPAPESSEAAAVEEDDFKPALSKKEQKKRDREAAKAAASVATITEPPAEDLQQSQLGDTGDDDWTVTPKLSKKEQKKREKASRAEQRAKEETSATNQPEQQDEFVDANEEWSEPPSKTKSKRKANYSWEEPVEGALEEGLGEGEVTVPVHAFDEPKKAEEEWNQPSSSKKKSKKKTTSNSWEDAPEVTAGENEVTVPVDAFDDPEEVDGDWDQPKKSKKDKKSRRKSTKDDYDPPDPDEPPDKARDPYEPIDRESSSVVSVPARYDDHHDSQSNGKYAEWEDDTKSIASAPATKQDQKKKEKRGNGFFGMFGKGANGTADDNEEHDSKKGNTGTLGAGVGLMGAAAVIAAQLSHPKAAQSPEREPIKTTVDVAEPSTRPRSISQDSHTVDPEIVERVIKPAIDPRYGDLLPLPPSEPGTPTLEQDLPVLPDSPPLPSAGLLTTAVGDEDGLSRRLRSASGSSQVVDPEIFERIIKPAIDPQYGDLLPLPPSEPGSPCLPQDLELPGLPDSRPDTPPEEREKLRTRSSTPGHVRRRSAFETPAKSPSHTAVPLQLRFGSSPSGFLRSSPLASPITPSNPDIGSTAKRLPRPTSWDNSREIKPLLLLDRASSSNNLGAEYKRLQSRPDSVDSIDAETSSGRTGLGVVPALVDPTRKARAYTTGSSPDRSPDRSPSREISALDKTVLAGLVDDREAVVVAAAGVLTGAILHNDPTSDEQDHRLGERSIAMEKAKEPESEAPALEPALPGPVALIRDVPVQQLEHAAITPSKKGKKGKKSRQGQSLDWDKESEATTLVEADGGTLELSQPRDTAETVDPFVARPTKKNKKKRVSQAWEPEPDPEVLAAPQQVTETTPPEDAVESTGKKEPPESPPSEPPASSSKSGKKKKGKKGPAWENLDEPTSGSTTPVSGDTRDDIQTAARDASSLESTESSACVEGALDTVAPPSEESGSSQPTPETPTIQPSQPEEDTFYTPERGDDTKDLVMEPQPAVFALDEAPEDPHTLGKMGEKNNREKKAAKNLWDPAEEEPAGMSQGTRDLESWRAEPGEEGAGAPSLVFFENASSGLVVDTGAPEQDVGHEETRPGLHTAEQVPESSAPVSGPHTDFSPAALAISAAAALGASTATAAAVAAAGLTLSGSKPHLKDSTRDRPADPDAIAEEKRGLSEGDELPAPSQPLVGLAIGEPSREPNHDSPLGLQGSSGQDKSVGDTTTHALDTAVSLPNPVQDLSTSDSNDSRVPAVAGPGEIGELRELPHDGDQKTPSGQDQDQAQSQPPPEKISSLPDELGSLDVDQNLPSESMDWDTGSGKKKGKKGKKKQKDIQDDAFPDEQPPLPEPDTKYDSPEEDAGLPGPSSAARPSDGEVDLGTPRAPEEPEEDFWSQPGGKKSKKDKKKKRQAVQGAFDWEPAVSEPAGDDLTSSIGSVPEEQTGFSLESKDPTEASFDDVWNAPSSGKKKKDKKKKGQSMLDTDDTLAAKKPAPSEGVDAESSANAESTAPQPKTESLEVLPTDAAEMAPLEPSADDFGGAPISKKKNKKEKKKRQNVVELASPPPEESASLDTPQDARDDEPAGTTFSLQEAEGNTAMDVSPDDFWDAPSSGKKGKKTKKGKRQVQLDAWADPEEKGEPVPSEIDQKDREPKLAATREEPLPVFDSQLEQSPGLQDVAKPNAHEEAHRGQSVDASLPPSDDNATPMQDQENDILQSADADELAPETLPASEFEFSQPLKRGKKKKKLRSTSISPPDLQRSPDSPTGRQPNPEIPPEDLAGLEEWAVTESSKKNKKKRQSVTFADPIEEHREIPSISELPTPFASQEDLTLSGDSAKTKEDPLVKHTGSVTQADDTGQESPQKPADVIDVGEDDEPVADLKALDQPRLGEGRDSAEVSTGVTILSPDGQDDKGVEHPDAAAQDEETSSPPQPEVETPTERIDAIAGDQFAPVGKKPKKDKKRLQLRQDSPVSVPVRSKMETELEPREQNEPADEPEDEQNSGTSSFPLQSEGDGLEGLKISTDEPINTKKSKKDKKKRKGKSIDDWEPEPEQPEALQQPTTTDDAEPRLSTETTAVGEELTLESEHPSKSKPLLDESAWETPIEFPTKESKKAKKKRKGKSRNDDWEPEPTTPMLEDVPSTTVFPDTEDSGFEQTASSTDIMGHPAPLFESTGRPESTVEAPEPLIGKRSKKDKQKKSPMSSWEPEPTDWEDQAMPEIDAQEHIAPAEDTKDEFTDFAASKKSKKDKKKKRMSLAWNEPESRPEVPETEEMESIPAPLAEPASIEDASMLEPPSTSDDQLKDLIDDAMASGSPTDSKPVIEDVGLCSQLPPPSESFAGSQDQPRDGFMGSDITQEISALAPPSNQLREIPSMTSLPGNAELEELMGGVEYITPDMTPESQTLEPQDKNSAIPDSNHPEEIREHSPAISLTEAPEPEPEGFVIKSKKSKKKARGSQAQIYQAVESPEAYATNSEDLDPQPVDTIGAPSPSYDEPSDGLEISSAKKSKKEKRKSRKSAKSTGEWDMNESIPPQEQSVTDQELEYLASPLDMQANDADPSPVLSSPGREVVQSQSPMETNSPADPPETSASWQPDAQPAWETATYKQEETAPEEFSQATEKNLEENKKHSSLNDTELDEPIAGESSTVPSVQTIGFESLTEEPREMQEHVEKEPDDLWAVPSKKSKKEKKRKGSKMTELEPSSSNVASMVEEPSLSDPVQLDVSTPSNTLKKSPAEESRTDDAGTWEPTADTKEDPEGQVSQMAEPPSVQPEDAWSKPIKSKKDKRDKKGKGLKAINPEPDSASSSLVPSVEQTGDPDYPGDSIATPLGAAVVAASATVLARSNDEQKPNSPAEAEPESLDAAPEEARAEDQWSIPTKKSKKDKKRKGSKIADAGLTSDPANATVIELGGPLADLIGGAHSTTQEIQGQESLRGMDGTGPTPQEIQSWTTHDTQGHPEPGEGRGLQIEELDGPAHENLQEPQDRIYIDAATPKDETPDIALASEVDILDQARQSDDIPKAQPERAPEFQAEEASESQIESAQELVVDTPPEYEADAQTNDDWFAPTKKSKKEKRKAKKAGSEYASGTATPQAAEGWVPEMDPSGGVIFSETAVKGEILEDLWEAHTKKYKTNKKSTSPESTGPGDDKPEQHLGSTVAEQTAPPDDAGSLNRSKTNHNLENPGPELMVDQTPKDCDEQPEFSVKPSKKDKKKTKKLLSETGADQPAWEELASGVEPTLAAVDPETDAALTGDVDFFEPPILEEPKEDEFPEFFTKKSKKGKKGKGKKADSESTSGAATPAAHDKGSLAELGTAVALATVAVAELSFADSETKSRETEEDEFPQVTRKQSKKDKKRRKGTALVWDDEPSANTESTTKDTPEFVEATLASPREQSIQEDPTNERSLSTEALSHGSLGSIEIDPAFSASLAASPDRGIMGTPTIGLGLIANPPVLYPSDEPSPKLLTAAGSPFPSQADSEYPGFHEALKIEEPGTLATSSPAPHELPLEASDRSRTVKTTEPNVEFSDPVVSSPHATSSLAGVTASPAEIRQEHTGSVRETTEQFSVKDATEEDDKPISAAREIAAEYFEHHHTTEAWLDEPPSLGGHDAPKDSTAVLAVSPNRDIAASYLERPHETGKGRGKGKKSDEVENHKDTSAAEDVAAVSGAVAGGVASLAQKFGGSKKKGKKKKYVDKRTPKEDDMFDDVLWEGGDRKPVEGSRMDMNAEDFWGVPSGEEDNEHGLGEEARDLGGKGGQEAAAPAQDQASHEVPRETGEGKHSGEASLLRQDSETIPRGSPVSSKNRGKESSRPRSRSSSPRPVQRAFSFPEDIADEEEFTTRATQGLETILPSIEATEERQPVLRPSPSLDFRRSISSLPPVKEEGSEEEDHRRHQSKREQRARDSRSSADTNRDSGFITGSPLLPKRSVHDDEANRDSGVHLREWTESTPSGTPKQREQPRFESTPGRRPTTSSVEEEAQVRPHDRDRPLRRSPVGDRDLRDEVARTSELHRLREPSPPPRTPEPEKLAVKKRTKRISLSPEQAQDRRSMSDTKAGRADRKTPDPPTQTRSASNTSLARLRTPEPLNLRPDSPGSLRSYSGTPPLRRVDRRSVSSDLRSVSLSQRKDDKPDQPPTSATATSAILVAGAAALGAAELISRAAQNNTPVANEGRVRAKDMTDVYDGYGEGRMGSPRSPTRPHSMRRRQSMQVLELESRVEQLMTENRMLAEARAHAETALSQKAAGVLAERDGEIDTLKRSLEQMQREVERLTQINEGLSTSTSTIAVQHHERVRQLETQHAEAMRALQSQHSDAARELETFRGAQPPQSVLKQKDAEIAELRAQVEAANARIREMQQQILAANPAVDSDFLSIKDVDHFDTRCQQLCSHVQQWVLRFSKFSDMRACRHIAEINDEKVVDRLDNAVLDGSDVDIYLRDRVRRRDIFMSMTMSMIWEFVFTRYLFGMDREQRQKLKTLEKQLLEVGPPHAVRQWRAVTLTLLSRRPQFREQRNQDTEAVVQAILGVLVKILPPPSNLEDQIQAQLRRVMREAVDLAIEMRTQRAEYMMLPPLQPEYDDTGELTETVTFNPALMNERSGDSSLSNDELTDATVRVVLFPLVVKKGDDLGHGDEEVVVCPAQVLIARSHSSGRRSARMVTPSSDAGGASLLTRSAGGNGSSLTMSAAAGQD